MSDCICFDEHPQEECGIIGIFAPHEDVARMAFFGLFALQHRGQEAAGIAVADGKTINLHKDVGLVSQVFNPQNLATMPGDYAIGHTRYSTTGSPHSRNAQPFLIETRHGPVAVAHNGNLVNAYELRQDLLRTGTGLSSTSDSEVLTMMLAGSEGATWEERLAQIMPRWVGAYSLVILVRDCVYAVRDPWGFRPLSVGLLPGGGHAVASESGALQTLGCVAIREVKPGEIVSLSNTALKVMQGMPPAKKPALCTFEHIYFSRPDSIWDGRTVHSVRQRLGRELARESAVAADVVIPTPDSGIPAAIGYAAASGIPYTDGFIKNRYIGRTFIEPTDSLRKQGIALKFNVVQENILNKRVVLIDDSIVRGNTTQALVGLLLKAGAREVHLRITCPSIRFPCYMGVDMGSYDELIAHRMSVEEITRHVGCHSLHFLSLEGMMRAIDSETGYCNACFTGDYPVQVEGRHAKTGFENGIA
ncbi:MAG TPA: amidophosphoribosyltransferase [Anaerolineaceae bacterium]|nr:amidophosphoribosyltransferase [Anaerolineaceae bacterium]HPN53263.1 amidophosphoribosyltransferase [Anaerolineaceae bacterium]